MFDNGVNQNFNYDSTITGNDNVINNDMNIDVNMMNSNNSNQFSNMMGPINENVQQRVVNRTFVHNVLQV